MHGTKSPSARDRSLVDLLTDKFPENCQVRHGCSANGCTIFLPPRIRKVVFNLDKLPPQLRPAGRLCDRLVVLDHLRHEFLMPMEFSQGPKKYKDVVEQLAAGMRIAESVCDGRLPVIVPVFVGTYRKKSLRKDRHAVPSIKFRNVPYRIANVDCGGSMETVLRSVIRKRGLQ